MVARTCSASGEANLAPGTAWNCTSSRANPTVAQFERIQDISVLTLVAVHCRARQPITAPFVDHIPAPGLRDVVIDAGSVEMRTQR